MVMQVTRTTAIVCASSLFITETLPIYYIFLQRVKPCIPKMLKGYLLVELAILELNIHY